MFVDFLRKTAKELNTIATLIEKAPEILKTLDKGPTVPQIPKSEPVSQDVLDPPENAAAATPEPPSVKTEPAVKRKPGRKPKFNSPAEKLAFQREYRRKWNAAHQDQIKAKQAEYRAMRKAAKEAEEQRREAIRNTPVREPTAPELLRSLQTPGQLRGFHQTLQQVKNMRETIVEYFEIENSGTVSLLAAEFKSHPDRYALIYRGHGIIDTNEKLLDELDPA